MVVLPRDFTDVIDPEMKVLNFASVVTGTSTLVPFSEPVAVELDPFVLTTETPLVLAAVPTIVVFTEAVVAPALPEVA